jgi:hypothetical protein
VFLCGQDTLAPFGPHRQFADTLLDPFFKKCPNCNGQGLMEVSKEDIFEITHGHDGTVCPVCKMGRYLFDGTPEEFEAIRKQVLTAYPGVESPKKRERLIPTTEPAPEPPPSPDEPKSSPPASPSATPQAFFAKPAGKSKKDLEKTARGLADALGKYIENEKNFQISDHRSKYTYLLRWWRKRGGTFYPKTDGIELRAITHPSKTLAVLFIESPYRCLGYPGLGDEESGIKGRGHRKNSEIHPPPGAVFCGPGLCLSAHR